MGATEEINIMCVRVVYWYVVLNRPEYLCLCDDYVPNEVCRLARVKRVEAIFFCIYSDNVHPPVVNANISKVLCLPCAPESKFTVFFVKTVLNCSKMTFVSTEKLLPTFNICLFWKNLNTFFSVVFIFQTCFSNKQ